MWKNSDTTSTEVTVQKSATNKIDVNNIDFKVTVDETNKVIKVISDIRAPNEESEGSRAYLSKLLPVILALWWSVLLATVSPPSSHVTRDGCYGIVVARIFPYKCRSPRRYQG